MTQFAPGRIATRLSWTIWVGLVCLMAVALLAACGGDGEEAAPSPEPVIQSTPVPTPADTPTPAPTPTPVPNTPTHVPDSSSFEVPHIDETTSWRDLTGALSEAELSCVQGELGEELYEAVLDGLVLRDIEAVEPWQGSLVGCLSQDTADDLFIATLEAGPEELSEESETCVRGILAGSDWRPIVFSQDPEGVEEAMTFGFNMMGCLFTDGMDEMGEMDLDEMDLGEMNLDEMEEFFGEDFDIDGP